MGGKVLQGWFGPWRALSHASARTVSKSSCALQAARGLVGWLCAGALPERSAWLHHYARDLLTPARCAELPPAAREAGQHWPRRQSFPSKSVALAGSDDAEARCAASQRCGGFAQSCGRCRSFDTGRSDPCARHQHGSCGRRFVHLVRFCAESSW